MQTMNKEDIKYCKIVIEYKNNKYESSLIDLSDEDSLQIVSDISEHGTNRLDMLKLPLTATKTSLEYLIFSKEQLKESLLYVSFYKTKPRKKKES